MNTITSEEYIKKNRIQLQINENSIHLMQRLLDFHREYNLSKSVRHPN